MKKLLLAAVILGTTVCMAQVPNAVLGTWHLSKTTKVTGGKPVNLSLQNGTFNCASCEPKPYSLPADGTQHPINNGGPYDSGSVTIVNPTTAKMVDQKGGKQMLQVIDTVSADGKTMTSTQTDDKGAVTTISLKRMSGPSKGAHAISGEWQVEQIESANPMIVTYKKGADGGLMYQDSTGGSYDAKFDGKNYEVMGPEKGQVSVKSSGPRNLEEDFKDEKGKPVLTSKTEVSADGKHATIDNTNLENGRTYHFMADKQ